MTQPLVSIIIATKNSGKTLEQCLQSVAAQTYPHKEVLIVDGVSTDDTLEIAERFKNQLAYLHSEPDQGVYSAWNKAIPKARGDWLYFLGSDDYFWKPTALEQIAARLTHLPRKVRLAYGQVAVISKKGAVVGMEGEPWHDYQARSLHEMVIPHQGTFHRRSLFTELGLFNEEFKICGDFELVLRELKHNHNPVFLEHIIVAGMQLGGLSSSLKNTPLIIAELKLARKLNRLPPFSRRIFMRQVRFHLRKNIQRFFGEKVTRKIADAYRQSVGKPKLWTREDV